MLQNNLTAQPGGETEKGGRRPGRPTLTNEQLLDKALDIFLEKGFERTSIEAITASAGMAKRTVYERYGDKSTLFKAALQRAIEEWIVPVAKLREAETDDLEETLIRIGEILVANVVSPAGVRLLRISNAESVRTPDISAFTYQQGTGPTLAYMADLFQRRLSSEEADLPDADQAALAFMYLVVAGPGSSTAWGVAFDMAALEKHVRYCVRLFLHGVLGRSDAVAAAPAAPPSKGGELAIRAENAIVANGAAGELQELQEENRRLRTLLVESMLEVAELRERRGARS